MLSLESAVVLSIALTSKANRFVFVKKKKNISVLQFCFSRNIYLTRLPSLLYFLSLYFCTIYWPVNAVQWLLQLSISVCIQWNNKIIVTQSRIFINAPAPGWDNTKPEDQSIYYYAWWKFERHRWNREVHTVTQHYTGLKQCQIQYRIEI